MTWPMWVAGFAIVRNNSARRGHASPRADDFPLEHQNEVGVRG